MQNVTISVERKAGTKYFFMLKRALLIVTKAVNKANNTTRSKLNVMLFQLNSSL